MREYHPARHIYHAAMLRLEWGNNARVRIPLLFESGIAKRQGNKDAGSIPACCTNDRKGSCGILIQKHVAAYDARGADLYGLLSFNMLV